MKISTIDQCKGCTVNKIKTDNIFCRGKIKMKIEDCPCVNCLVKVICRTSCYEFSSKIINGT
ncbi:MAG: hypothetical protein ACFFG0_00060 [Candidatus Thorarchaeota archaeon]